MLSLFASWIDLWIAEEYLCVLAAVKCPFMSPSITELLEKSSFLNNFSFISLIRISRDGKPDSANKFSKGVVRKA